MKQHPKHIATALFGFLIWQSFFVVNAFSADPRGVPSTRPPMSAWSYSAGTAGTFPIADLVCPMERICFGSAANQVIKTTDSGKIFYTVYKTNNLAPGTLSARPSIWFIDSKKGFAGIAGNGFSGIKTRDGGKTWKEFKDQAFAGRFAFFDEMHGFSGTQNEIRFTKDGGKSWKTSNVFKDKEEKENLVLSDSHYSFPSLIHTRQNRSMSGFIVAFHSAPGTPDVSYLLRTQNGGSTWSVVNSDLPNNLRSVFFKDPDHGWIGTEGGHIFKTINGGSAWKDGALSGEIRQIQCLTKERCYAIGLGMIYMSKDGGNNWTLLQPADITKPIIMEAVAFTDFNHGLIGGGLAPKKDLTNQAIVLYTASGGIPTLNHK